MLLVFGSWVFCWLRHTEQKVWNCLNQLRVLSCWGLGWPRFWWVLIISALGWKLHEPGTVGLTHRVCNCGKTFFSKECGLHEIALAVSNRSSCYYCKNPIPKGSVRCSCHFNTLRPSVWVHGTCLKHLTERDGFASQTKDRLAHLKRQSSSSEPKLAKAIEELLSSVWN